MANTVAEFTKEELKQLIEDEKLCVHLKRSVLSLALFPCHLGDFNSSIKQILNSKKAKYDKVLGGILLGYKNIKLITCEGTIVTDSCYVHIDIEGDFYIFKPEIGSTLKGIVNKVGTNHIGCLVHKLFNITVHKGDKGDDWLGNFVHSGNEVILNVTFIDLHSRLPYIVATLDEKQFENTVASKTKKNALNEEISIDEENNLTETPVCKKKKHKSNINSLINSYEELDDSVVSREKKKKHKSKKNNRELINDISIKNDEELQEKEKRHEENENNNHQKIKKEKKNKRKSKEYDIEYKDIKTENNETIKKRDSINGFMDEQSVSASKKKSKKHSKSNADNTSTNEDSINLIQFNSSMADFEDRKNRKKKNDHISKIALENIELNLHDSDLEKTLNELSKEKKKRKKDIDKSVDQDLLEEPNPKKRKREDVSDEEIVKKHKKKKRHSVNTENT